jgi:glycosyltransferase involved in cell wall biosynthesis
MVPTACSIIARNYLAHARVMARSFLAHHPGAEVVMLLIDDESRTVEHDGDPFRLLRLADIGLSAREIAVLATAYDVLELATAVKPALLRWLLDEGRPHVAYFDPDVKFYDRVDPVFARAEAHATVVTPHTTGPVPDDGRGITTRQILAAGIYNLGFIAVSRRSMPFIDWWWNRTRREALNDPHHAMFTDQRWVDLLPALFDCEILKDPGYNVAYWNLHAQPLSWGHGRYLAGDAPLRFFHFSGFDRRTPHLLSRHQGSNPRFLLSEHPLLAALCADYVRDLQREGIETASASAYGWSRLPSGQQMEPRMRRLYWQALVAHEHDGSEAPPTPFEAGGEPRFLAWLQQPADDAPHGLSRYLAAVWATRPDLQRAFPGVLEGKTTGFFEWARWIASCAPEDEGVTAALLDRPGERLPATDLPPGQGVTLSGYLTAACGVGEAARLLRTAVIEAGEAHAIENHESRVHHSIDTLDATRNGPVDYDVNIICVNADQLPRFAAKQPPGFFTGRYSCGYWFWELERFPKTLEPAFAYVDEVWAATAFTAEALNACHQKPVFTVPIPLPVPRVDPSITRARLDMPDGFVFLFCFDFLSVAARKNPIGVIDAFRLAFRPNEGPRLLIKSINGHMAVGELEALRAAAAGSEDIRVVDRALSAAERDALIAQCDCYVSLHRSEGLGLTLAEAMALGKPVIGTAYSGNLSFMTERNSFLVDYTTGHTPEGCHPYPAGVPWAEPNLFAAAGAMRFVFDRPDMARRRAERGLQDILTLHSAAACAPVLAARLEAIRSRGLNGSAIATPAVAVAEPGCD